MISFRRRIRYSALTLVSVLLLIFSVLVFVGFERLMREYIDKRLLQISGTWARIVQSNWDILTRPHDEIGAEVYPHAPDTEKRELREAALWIRVLSLDGKVLWRGQAGEPRPPLAPALLAKVREGQSVYETFTSPDNEPCRRISIPVYRDGHIQYILQAETSLLLKNKTQNGLVILLIAASWVILGLAWVGSGWHAQKVLAPVEVLSNTAQKVSESSLNTRLILDPPYQEFRRLRETFNGMMERLQKVFEAQRRFIADASHEILTPLTVLKGNLEVAFRTGRSEQEYREVLIGNFIEVDRLIALARSLITLAQFAGANPPLRVNPIALEPIVSELVSNIKVLGEARGINMRLETETVPLVMGDEAQLKRVLINLLSNALRYTNPEGTVSVRLRSAGKEVILSVQDTGQGIAHDHLPHIFERFYRTDRARAKDSGGAGLGLAIVKEIIEAHKGSVKVESEVGKGSVFTIILPVLSGNDTKNT
jgi:heavy metal sensor kinase